MIELTVAVRELAAFCHRRGDIDYRFTPSPTGEQGIAGHQQVYRRRPDSYQREYPVAYLHQRDGLSLQLRGRADGYDPEQGMVEEIKTCRVLADTIPATVTRLHLAQARLYGAMIALEQDLPGLQVRLTWFNIDSAEEQVLSQHYSRAELEAFLLQALQQFSGWLQTLAELRRSRDESLAALAFPHGNFRAGQREIAELVYKCIDQGGELMLEAPTGIGKTAAVMYPALKALATGKHDALVFVTARTVGRRTAEQYLTLCREQGLVASALSITARDRVCFSPGRACHGDDCPYARGYYDRLGEAMQAAIRAPSLGREQVEEVAREFEVCPYQLALDLLPWVDLVIADQHYLYSLSPTLGSLMEQDERRWTVLLDEAHNLPERARTMYCARLAKASLMPLRRDIDGAVGRALDGINRALLVLQREDWLEDQFDSRAQLPQALLMALQGLVTAVAEQMATEADFLQRQPGLMDFYFELLQFLRVADCWGDDFRFEMKRGSGRQSLQVTLNCLDPGRLLAQRQQRAHAVAAFSATLSPAHWSRSLLGLADETVCRRLDSPFEVDQLQVELECGIDTRYQQRQQTLSSLAGVISDWLFQVPGNCMVYFPSYRYMQDCLALLRPQLAAGGGRTLWQQEPDQGEDCREELLQLLASRREVAAFCILGGVFGEGIDLPGEQLASVVVVGIGLPQVNREREQLRGWYEASCGEGFAFAYLYPGMQKVAQALGRVIRTPQDRGRALLVDSRYARENQRALLPPWWTYSEADN